MSESRFRVLLVLYLLATFASALTAFLPDGFSPELTDAFAKEPEPWLVRDQLQFLVIAVPFLLAALAGLVGLFMFKWWGRMLSLYTTLVGFIIFPFFGPSLTTGLADTFTELSSILWGAVLACAYYSSISARFVRARGDQR